MDGPDMLSQLPYWPARAACKWLQLFQNGGSFSWNFVWKWQNFMNFSYIVSELVTLCTWEGSRVPWPKLIVQIKGISTIKSLCSFWDNNNLSLKLNHTSGWARTATLHGDKRSFCQVSGLRFRSLWNAPDHHEFRWVSDELYVVLNARI